MIFGFLLKKIKSDRYVLVKKIDVRLEVSTSLYGLVMLLRCREFWCFVLNDFMDLTSLNSVMRHIDDHLLAERINEYSGMVSCVEVFYTCTDRNYGHPVNTWALLHMAFVVGLVECWVLGMALAALDGYGTSCPKFVTKSSGIQTNVYL
ncbi:hypothetical protein POM88_031484 [Heracleum sosnowskyi]|uniref:Uncharacterized protein n=1 Tax=Heracleum sosnowskyi TaxID=360622 RepID=A0AAD8HXV9_9APIA|nr:hypothetical protein POM88_031484 [Heracleum sosnowskyi]